MHTSHFITKSYPAVKHLACSKMHIRFFFFADFQMNSLFFQVCSCSGSTYVFRLTIRDVNYGKQHEFAVLKIKSYVSNNKKSYFLIL